jgi:hypothetical protein
MADYYGSTLFLHQVLAQLFYSIIYVGSDRDTLIAMMHFTFTTLFIFLAALLLSCQHVDAVGYCNAESLKRGCQRIGLDGFFEYTFSTKIPVSISFSR